ncbi:MAG: Spermidine synthase [Myxococcales bacterium]|nr:Spermidine synthase [Myxococcales bacterium]
MNDTPVRRVALLLFGSGMCALIYQVAWLRELRLVFGASTAASAAVLAVFMGGLGAGGLVFGRRAAAAVRPLRLYATLEMLIAGAAALTPMFVFIARWVYAAVGGTPTLGLGAGTVVRLILAALVLAAPTVLMGGTLPAAAQAVARPGDVGRRDLAILYGANTLGAVAGASLSTFVLLEALGTRYMLLSACAVNIGVAVLARWLSSRMPDRSAETDAAAAAVATVASTPAAGDDSPAAASPPAFTLAAAAIVGFAFLLMELVWYRMLAPILGGSSFTFGLILAVALLGIGMGGVAYALGIVGLGGRRAATLPAFALTCALEAVAMAIPWALGDRIAIWAATLRPLGSVGFSGYVVGWLAITALVILPAAFISGVQFPLLIALYGRGRTDVGRQVGHAYAWNTAGAIAGSLAGGFGLMPLLSAPGCWRLVAALLAVLGLVAVALAEKPRVESMIAPILAAGLALGLLIRPGPTAAWRHGSVGVGRAPSTGTPNSLEEWARTQRRYMRWEVDGVESSVALNDLNGYAFVVNGKVDGSFRSDASTQVMAGLMGALVHPAVHRALVVGLGTGSTAGWLGQVPTMERVDVVELEPAILEIARRGAPVNRDVLANPRVHVTIGDAREVVGTTRQRYDLIFSEPSNPYRAGIASLFTQEFYRAASDRLGEDGLFVQWLQAYNVDAQTIRTIYATIESVFPEVETWITEESDLLLIAGKHTMAYDVTKLRKRIAEEPWRTALSRVWRADDLEAVFARYVANAELARVIGRLERGKLNTDDLTLVEFGFARGLGFRSRQFDVSELRTTAYNKRWTQPLLEHGALDWKKVGDRMGSMLVADWRAPLTLAEASPEQRHRAAALDKWEDGSFTEALAEWRAQPDDPSDSLTMAAFAESLAEAGDAAAEPWIAKLRPMHDTEADVYLARLRLRQGRVADATNALDSAFVRAGKDPWFLPVVLERGVDLAVEIAKRDKPAGERLYQRLRQPFAVAIKNDARLKGVVAIAYALDWPRLCQEALTPLEPHFPFSADLLLRRMRCYETNKDPRLAVARHDLARYVNSEPLPFSAGM